MAALTGLLTGIIGVAMGMPWTNALYFIAGTVAKDMILFLRQAPDVTKLSDNTTVMVKKSDI